MELNLTGKQWKFCDNDTDITAFLKSLCVCTDLVGEFRIIKAIKIDSDTKICKLITNKGTTFGFYIYGYDYTTIDSKPAVILSYATYWGGSAAKLIIFPYDNKLNVVYDNIKAPEWAHEAQKREVFLI